MNPLVQYTLADGVATLLLDDGKANAMSVQMLGALNTALDQAEKDGAVLLLAGRSQMFCGGFDLGVFKRSQTELLQMLEAGARITERLIAFPRPVVVACTGHAVAMGVFLLQCGDVRIAVEQGARIQVNEVAIGMTLPHFALEVCRQRLTPAQLHLATVTAMPYTPQQALAAGFLDELAPAETVLDVARARAVALTQLHPAAFTATKLRKQQAVLASLRQAVADDIAGWKAQFASAG